MRTDKKISLIKPNIELSKIAATFAKNESIFYKDVARGNNTMKR